MAVIFRSVEELQLEQKGLTYMVLLKEKQLDLLQSAMTNNHIANQPLRRYVSLLRNYNF
jgi:hypothetical protein